MDRVEALFGSAVAAHRSGQHEQARSQYQQVLKLAPNHYGALLLLGKLYRELEDAKKAVKTLRRAIDVNKGEASAYLELGAVYMQGGDERRALNCITQAAKIAPANPAVHASLGDIYRAMGEAEKAAASYRAALRHAPGEVSLKAALGEALLDAGAHDEAIELWSELVDVMRDTARARVNLASAHFFKGDYAEAETHYRKATEAFPEDARGFVGLGSSLEARDAYDEAVGCYYRAIEIDPGEQDAHRRVSQLLERLGRMEEGAAVFERAVKTDPDCADFHAELSWFLVQLGSYEDAEASARRAIELDKGAVLPLMTLGKLEVRRGRFDEAEGHYRALLKRRPGDIGALLGLVEIQRLKPQDAGIADLEAILDKLTLTSGNASQLHTLVGKMLEKEGRYAQAFKHFKASADISKRANSFDLPAYLRRMDAITGIFDGALVEKLAKFGSDSDAPIFVTGMPRSGTTLVEQIIASHPRVTGCGEVEFLEPIISALEAKPEIEKPYPDCVPDLDKGAIGAMAKAYLSAMQQKAPGAERVTDKSISTFRQLGLAAILFPRARFIHCMRDPMDTCLSCYVQGFNRPTLAFTYDLEQLGIVYRDYLRLMDYWREVLPVDILDVQYEELIADQEAQSRRIIAHCGLDWDDACLAYHQNSRTVHTASMWQVRQPIYSSSVGKWRNYEQELAPLRAALETDRRARISQ